VQYPGWSLGMVPDLNRDPNDTSEDLGHYTHAEAQEPAPWGMTWLEFYTSPLTREQDECLSLAMYARKMAYMSHHPQTMYAWEEARYMVEFARRVIADGYAVARSWLTDVESNHAATYAFQQGRQR
jgi:hypothetical protein